MTNSRLGCTNQIPARESTVAIIPSLASTSAPTSTLQRLALAAIIFLAGPLSAAVAQNCKAPTITVQLEHYNANIETYPKLATVKPGQLVEFNAEAVSDHIQYLRGIAAKGGIPEWYWVGANCNKGPDCAVLEQAKVKLGSTGTAEWNKTEYRIYDLAHPSAIARAEQEMRRALTAAAAAKSHLVFRIDNMHDLDDPRFYDTEHKQSFAELRAMTETWARIENEMRAAGSLQPTQITGLTAHNNFAFWKDLLASGGKPPIVLRIENPTQFETSLVDGLDIMSRYKIPLIAVEFEEGHLYKPTPEGLKSVSDRVSIMMILANEDNYIGGRKLLGPGPRQIVWRPHAEICGNAGGISPVRGK